MLSKKIAHIRNIGEKMHAPEWLIDELSAPRRVLKMRFPASIAGKEKNITAIRVHHCNPYPEGARPYKGGTRFHPGVSEELLTVLAMDMTEKCALAGLPFGGAKGGIAFDPKTCTEKELRDITEAMTREMLKSNIPHPDIDVPGPDMGTDSRTMYTMYRAAAEANHFRTIPNIAACVTGKPIEHDGIPGRENATSHGLLILLKEFIRLTKHAYGNHPRIAIQGMGNVGGNTALLAREQQFNFKIIALSGSKNGTHNPRGIDVSTAKKWYDAHGSFSGFKGGALITNEELLTLKTDVLIPAAIENQITEKNAHAIRAKTIVEGANEAITSGAHNILADRGISAIPGIAANAGGVIVSYLEWRKNYGDKPHPVDFDEEKIWVTDELTRIMHTIIRNVHARSKKEKCSLSDAAHVLAFQKIHSLLSQKYGK